MYTMRLTATMALLSIATSGALNAQDTPRQCGTVDGVEALIPSVMNVFWDEGADEVRAAVGINALPQETQAVVITERSVCREVMKVVMAFRDERMEGMKTHLKDIDFTVFEVGPYYVVSVSAAAPKDPTIDIGGSSEHYFLQASDLTVLGRLLI